MGTITVANLGKAYKQYPTRWSRLIEWLDPRGKPRHQLHWVLQDINFVVNPGEAVGIIGINGAGKSTLLKMVTGTTQPTTGGVEISGRVAALLELGMGFHPDFTGRQNVYMAGQLLGLSAEEIGYLMPQIEAFAEIGDYIDQPVRVYSSGMQMRLAFSVATAQRPDVLIVDEALSVGDAYFQHKSFDRIREFGRKGTTLFIVSHDQQAIQSICDRAILLNDGGVSMDGEPEAVMDYYKAMLAASQAGHVIQFSSATSKGISSGTGEVLIVEVVVKDRLGNRVETIHVGQEIAIHIELQVNKDVPNLVMGCGFKDRYGQTIFGTNTLCTNQVLEGAKAGERYSFVMTCNANFGVGHYSIFVAAHAAPNHLGGNYHWVNRAVVFEVVNVGKHGFVGLAWSDMTFSIAQSSSALVNGGDSAQDKNIKLAKTAYGEMYVYSDDQVIGASLLQAGGFQEDRIEEVTNFLIQRFSFSPELFVDIGANIGTHTVFALRSNLFTRAISFEPDINNFTLLESNVALNGIGDKVSTNKLALSDENSSIEMELSNSNYGDHRIKARRNTVSFGEEIERKLSIVECVTVDSFLVDTCQTWKNCLIWMDTQGHEGQIFKGGGQYFSSFHNNYVVSEFWPYGIERSGGKDAYFDFLRKCSRVYDINRPQWQDGDGIEIDELMRLYEEMLAATEKESHPHTDLLLILRMPDE